MDSVLLVGDADDLGEVQRLLQERGVSVTRCSQPDDVVEAAKRCHARLVVIDFAPDLTVGRAACGVLRTTPDAPPLATMIIAPHAAREECDATAAELDAVVAHHPIEHGELCSRIQNM